MARRIHFVLTPQSSPERLEKQRANVQKNKPWKKSTGPVTAEGKKRSSQNGRIHGLYSEEHQQLKKALHKAETNLKELDDTLTGVDEANDE